MEKRRRFSSLLLTALLLTGNVLVLTGCVGQKDIQSPAPTSSPVPNEAFATDLQALNAAKTTFSQYQRISDAILADGGKKPERLQAYATSQQYADELTGYEEIAANNYHSVGRSSFDSASLQGVDESGVEPRITVYLCIDVSGLDVLDNDGQSVVSSGRVERSPVEVVFTQRNGKLVVSDKSEWTGDDFCN